MAIVDKQGRLFGKINIIDLSFILIALLVVGFIYVQYFRGADNGEAAGKRIEYEVELKIKTKEYADVIKIGDEIRDSIKGHYLGKVIEKKVLPAFTINENAEKGEYVKAEVPDRYDVILTLEANGIVTSGSILAEGVEVKVGQKMYIKGKGYASRGYILGLRYE